MARVSTNGSGAVSVDDQSAVRQLSGQPLAMDQAAATVNGSTYSSSTDINNRFNKTSTRYGIDGAHRLALAFTRQQYRAGRYDTVTTSNPAGTNMTSLTVGSITPLTLSRRDPAGNTSKLADWGVDSEYGLLRDVLLGPAQTFRWMVENAEYSSIVRDTLRKGYKFDKDLAVRQHEEMMDAYRSAGVTVHVLPENEHTPNGVYARDSSFMTPYGAVVCQLANPRRRGEYANVLQFYTSAGIPVYDMVSAGNFEGGDFNIIGPGCALIGYTGFRCEEVAAKQIGGWFEKEGWEIKYAPMDSFYVHIDLMVVMLAEKLAAVCVDTTEPDILDWLKGKGIEFVEVGFKDTMALGCNVMSLGDDRVLSPLESADLNAKLRALGFEVYDPSMTMYTRAGGGVHCMAQPLRRDPG